MADFTKSRGQLKDWTLLDDTATDTPTVDSGELDLSGGDIGCILHLVVAHADVVDAATSPVYINVMTKKGSGNEDWGLFAQLQAGGGQAVTEALDAESASGQKQVKVAATTDWDTGQLERLFLLDGTPANSELVTVMGWADADYYLVAENLSNTHAIATALFDGVDEIPVYIPPEFQTVKVLFGNSHGTATYYLRVDYELITDIE